MSIHHKKPIRVGIEAHVLEVNRFGVGRCLTELFKYCQKNPSLQNEFEFILYFKEKIPQDPLLHQKNILCRVLRMPCFRPSFTLFFNFFLPFVALKDKLDFCFFPCYMVPFTFLGKSIIMIHDLAYEAHPEWFFWRYKIPYWLFSRWGAWQSKAIITVSEFSKREIIKYYGIKPEKIFVCPLGISNHFRPISQPNLLEKIKKKYGIRKEFIFYTGQILPRRHLIESLFAFEKIARELPDYQFLFAGKNKTYPFVDIDELVKKINRKLGREAVIKKDYFPEEDLPLLFNAAKLFIWLTTYEGFGLPLVEALACGTPVLTTHFGASQETIGQAGFFVKNPQDINETACKLKEALKNKQEREKKRKLGLEQVKKLSWERYAQKMLNVFRRVANL